MDRATNEPDTVRKLTISGVPEEARNARSFARMCLARLGCAPEAIDDAELVVSELVTNGINAAPGRDIELSIFPISDYVAIYVYDPVDDLPVEKRSGPMDESGRGIPIVRRYAQRYGVFRSASGGKVVWAMVRRYA